MLRQILDPKPFRTLLRRFLKNFAGGRPVTPDFSDTVKKVAGENDKDWFYKNFDDWFEDWYIDPGHAKIRFSWSVQKEAEGYLFTGRILQDPEEFKMVLAPITLRFDKHPASALRFFVDEPDYEFQLHLPGEPTEVVFDELKTLAAEVTVEEE
jgi:aminopeptidase N